MRASQEGKFLTSSKREPSFRFHLLEAAFRRHQASDCHREANEAVVVLPKQTGDVADMLSVAHREEKASNRKVFLALLQNLARQGLALRGGDADVDSNYNQLILLRSNDIADLSGWTKKKTNKYTSHDIHNECLKIMALQIVQQLSRDVRGNTIMTDECTDKSNHEQFTICITGP